MLPSRRARPYRYTGKLGRKSDSRAMLPTLRKAIRIFATDHPNASEVETTVHAESVVRDLEKAHRQKLMVDLMRHWKVKPTDPDAASQLAEKLAMAHVPAFQIVDLPRRGRPPKDVNRLARQERLEPLDKIVQWPPKPEKRRSRGAPLIWTNDEYKKLLRQLDAGEDALRAQGKTVTNRAALIEFATTHKRNGTGFKDWTDGEIRKEAKRRASRVADARRALRKIETRSGK